MTKSSPPSAKALVAITALGLLGGCLVFEDDRGARERDPASEGPQSRGRGTPGPGTGPKGGSGTGKNPLPRDTGAWSEIAFRAVLENTPELARAGATMACTFPYGLQRLAQDGVDGPVKGCKVLVLSGVVPANQVAAFEGVEKLYIGGLDVRGDLSVTPEAGSLVEVSRIEAWMRTDLPAALTVTGGIELADMAFAGSKWLALRADEQGRLPRARLSRLSFRGGTDNETALSIGGFGNANAAKDAHVEPVFAFEDLSLTDYQRPLSLGVALDLAEFAFSTTAAGRLKRAPAIVLPATTHYLPKSTAPTITFVEGCGKPTP